MSHREGQKSDAIVLSPRVTRGGETLVLGRTLRVLGLWALTGVPVTSGQG